MNYQWTKKEEELVRKLWTQGASASTIAQKLGGLSRNAVIGKARRLGLNGRKPTSRERIVAMRAKAPGATSHAGAIVQRRVRMAERRKYRANQPEPVHTPETAVHSIIDLKRHHCRWPIGEPGKPGFAFCGAQKTIGSSYCQHHDHVSQYGSAAREASQ